MAYRQSQDREPPVLDLADDTVIANPITPQSGHIAFKGFAKMARVFATLQAVFEPVEQPLLGWAVKFTQLPLGKIADLNRPGQDPSSGPLTIWRLWFL